MRKMNGKTLKTFWLWKALGIVFAIIALAFFAGFVYERVSRAVAEARYKPYGSFAEVAGHQLNYVKNGIGSPTVIFETGHTFTGHVDWMKIQESVSEFTTTLSYSRSGLLWSERGTNPKTSAAISAELQELLEKAGCAKPYILVCHSFGGITIRKFIQDNAQDIAGIVLIDTLNPKTSAEAAKRGLQGGSLPPAWLMRFSGEIGVARIKCRYILPNTEKHDYVNKLTNTLMHRGLSANIEEELAAGPISAEALELGSFGNIPLVVITGGQERRIRDMGGTEFAVKWGKLLFDMQKDLLNLSTNSKLVIAEESGHEIHWEQPELVARIIRELESGSMISAGIE